ncbi:copper chaperone PCu(A)C [Bosea sp. ANAM02]|uniref:copper chaperone PCu(A)C n=1 Tax=Bosea sp. ANAM02 TaxID=2020412 RepID=UPI00140EF9AE|nr:copper chaperone PCu(A)C [Bosea sp. ANAM02]BCB17150.1 hypothetical protein OCUBac02_00440 [Bosea sp. ANAM02]
MIRAAIRQFVSALGHAERVETPTGKAIARTVGLALIGIGPFLLLGLSHIEPAARANGVSVIHPWTRGMALVGDELPVYVTIENTGKAIDRLIAVETPVAASAVFENVANRATRARNTEIDEIVLAPETKTGLKPDQRQIRLVGLKQKIEPGGTIPVSFVFARAGRVTADVRVENFGQPAHDDHS